MMHETMQRVMNATQLNTAEIAKRIGTTPQKVNNWANRGISKKGALDISKAFDLDLNWVLTGQGKMTDTPFDNTPNDLFDDKLIHQAIQLSGLNQSEVINQALQLFIAFQKEQAIMQAQEEMRKLRGKLHWEGDLKQMRSHFDDECT